MLWYYNPSANSGIICEKNGNPRGRTESSYRTVKKTICTQFTFCRAWLWLAIGWFTHIIHIFQGYLTGAGAIVRLPHCQWSNPEPYVYIYRRNSPLADDRTTTKQDTTQPFAHFMEYTVDKALYKGGSQDELSSLVGNSNRMDGL